MKINKFILILRKRYFPNKMEIEHKKWKSINGDKTLRLDYDELNKQSNILDVGGYIGDFASDIYSKYQSNIIVFEPVENFYNFTKKRFKSNQKIKVFNYGLSIKNMQCDIFLNDNASSTYSVKNRDTEKISLKNIVDVVKDLKIEVIDLIKINIEGDEYGLLDLIISSGLIFQMKNIQVQFHSFVKDAQLRRNEIHRKLLLTHDKTFCYDFIWENWKKKV